MAEPKPDNKPVEVAFKLLVAGLLAVLCYHVLAPFLLPLVWGVILAISFQPVYYWMIARMGGWEKTAACIITAITFVLFAGPVGYLATTMIRNTRELANDLRSGAITIPEPPAGIETWPLVGEFLAEQWTLATTDVEQLVTELEPQFQAVGGWLLTAATGFGQGFLQFMIAIVIAGLLLPRFEATRISFYTFAERITGPRGAYLVELGGATVRNVSVGIMGIALVQGLLAGLAFVTIQVPAAGLLAFLVMLFSAVQIGPAIVIIPVIIYAFLHLSILPAVLFTVVIIPVMLLDNVLKPIFVSRGLDTPMVVVFIGIVGGVLAYGVVGLFVGPVALGIGYSLLREWMQADKVPSMTAEGQEKSQ